MCRVPVLRYHFVEWAMKPTGPREPGELQAWYTGVCKRCGQTEVEIDVRRPRGQQVVFRPANHGAP